ncbi:MAG TPA: HAD family hydrolase [Candidatus Cloacimonadota bacterium]|nr:HAD family hydrolase [Candidatus Cloacimonadota bacterium]
MDRNQGTGNWGRGAGKAVFLDRDGTINPDAEGYIHHPDQFELFSYTIEAIKKIHALGYYVFVVTNQSGIARGYFTMEEVEAIHAKLSRQLEDGGTHLDAIYYSPYLKEGTIPPWNCEHPTRKPNIGMFDQAMRDFEFNPHLSWMIGDKYQDIEFGYRAGLKTILVLSGNGKKEFFENRENWIIKPDFVVQDLLSAVDVIELMS